MSQVQPVNLENGLHRPDGSQQPLQASMPELVELHAFMQSVSNSIANLEISMASQSITLQDLQKTLTSQSSSILHLQASLNALPIRTNSPKSEKVKGKSFSVLSCPNPELSSQRSPQSSRRSSRHLSQSPGSRKSSRHSSRKASGQSLSIERIERDSKCSKMQSMQCELEIRSPQSGPSLHPPSLNPSPSKVRRSKINASKESRSENLQEFQERHGRPLTSVKDLEDHQAILLRRGSRKFSRRCNSLGDGRSDRPRGHGKTKASTLNSRPGGTANETALSNRGWMSMDQLQQNYDAVVVGRSPIKQGGFGSSGHVDHRGASALPRVGRFFLCLVGHLNFGEGLASRFFGFLSYALLPAACTAFLVVLAAVTVGITSQWSFTMVLTLCFFQLGISFASHSFRSNGIQLLLGPKERQLDEYAEEGGFMQDWQRLSRRRLIETLCVFLCMLLLRAMVNFWLDGSFAPLSASRSEEAVFGWMMWLMVVRYLMFCYSVLHVGCAFELALDSFTLRFFKEMDIEEGLEDWNILQATLRQVSTKLSDSLMTIGFCCVAGVAVLAEKAISDQTDQTETGQTFDMIVHWLSRFYPLIFFFLYTLARTAAVTQKANRVAPLVNSWKFQCLDEEEEATWMDQGRQYAVQYISQSKAGFYLRGAQLTVPHVQKCFYYLGAISFALLSRLWR